MPNIATQTSSVHSGGAGPLLDHQIAQAQEEISRQRETVYRLAADGHEVRDARKQLVAKLERLASLMKLRASSP